MEAPESDLDREGFKRMRLATAAGDLFDEDAIRGVYYPEVERLANGATGTERVLAFDHDLRSGRTSAEGENLGLAPVRCVHNGYTKASAPQRVRDLMGEVAEGWL